MTAPDPRLAYPVSEAARLLSVSPRQVLRLIESRDLEASDIGNGSRPRWRVKHTEIVRYLDERSTTRRAS